MLDIDMIESEIAALESEETTYDTCGKLADLYIVRDEYRKQQVSKDPTTSEFLAASVGVPVPSLMKILDEHMEGIKVLYPDEYKNIVDRITKLHE